MDPALEEASQVIGASRWRTMWRVTLPLVAPGVLGAAIFVFAEMLGSFSAALVLGTPARFYVITTAIYQFVSQYPPRIPACRGDGRVAVRRDVRDAVASTGGSPRAGAIVTVTGKAFRPRAHGHGTAALGAVRRRARSMCSCPPCCRSRRWPSRPCRSCRCPSRRLRQLHARQFPPGAVAQRRALAMWNSADPRRCHGDDRRRR